VTRAAPAQIGVARSPAEIEAVRALFREYAAGLGIDLGFEGFPAEVAGLPGAYAPPTGTLLLARDALGPAGCVGVRPFDPIEAEMKRLYVRPRARGSGLGRRLVEEALRATAAMGYRALRLDTLPTMAAATRLYGRLGFVEFPEPKPNPIAGTRYFLRRIDAAESGRTTSK
jgi:putative acetyltransferase